jgi:hypothetical protein
VHHEIGINGFALGDRGGDPLKPLAAALGVDGADQRRAAAYQGAKQR